MTAIAILLLVGVIVGIVGIVRAVVLARRDHRAESALPVDPPPFVRLPRKVDPYAGSETKVTSYNDADGCWHLHVRVAPVDIANLGEENYHAFLVSLQALWHTLGGVRLDIVEPETLKANREETRRAP